MGEAATVRKYLEAQDPRDSEALASCRHPDFEVIWPQTGERVPNHEAEVQIHDHYPGYPSHSMKRAVGQEAVWWEPRPQLGPLTARPVQVSGGGDLWIADVGLTYGGGDVWCAVMVVEMLAGLVRRETSWFAPTFRRPDWRIGLSEDFEWAPPEDVVETTGTPGTTRAREVAMNAYFATVTDEPTHAHEQLFHPDVVLLMPQSSERIVGRAGMLDVFLRNPHRPKMEVRRVRVVGSVGLSEVLMQEGIDVFWGVGIAEFEGEKVQSITQYWAPKLDAPEWRAPWVERLEPD